MYVVVGVSGGIAAYKAVSLVRLLVTLGHEVHVVPTPDAVRFVGLPTWEAISRHPVTTSVHEGVASVRHVALGQAADLVIVAPATANTIAKMAAGIADDLLGTTLLATTAPVVIAPAMHTEMWRHPATQHNIAVLRERGAHVIGPADGALTGGDSGPGRLVKPADIVEAIGPLLASDGPKSRQPDASGLRFLVTAGGTREPIDPVRFIGNRSSGRQGIAIALAAADRGASVDLVLAHVDDHVAAEASAHPLITIHHAGSALDLRAAVERLAPSADVVIMAAAVADYRVLEIAERKLTKDRPGGESLTLELVQNPDILRGVVEARDADRERAGQTIVGFAAETVESADELLARARAKRERKGVDLLVVNEVGWQQGFEASENAVVVIDRTGAVVAETAGAKGAVAATVIDQALRAHEASVA